MQIFAKVPGYTVTLEVSTNTPVWVVKAMVYFKENVSVPNQILTFAGKYLDEGRTLGDYKIPKESTIYVHYRLRGGMYAPQNGRDGFAYMAEDAYCSVGDALPMRSVAVTYRGNAIFVEVPETATVADLWPAIAKGFNGHHGFTIRHRRTGAVLRDDRVAPNECKLDFVY